MPASVLGDNPFAVLTAVVAPAVLTNACSVLSLGTGNRIARVVDRTRALAANLATTGGESAEYERIAQQISSLRTRAQHLFKALRLIYAALACFAGSALISVIGSALAYFNVEWAFHAAAIMGLAVGAFAVASLVIACSLLVDEVRLALRNMSQEAEDTLGRCRRDSHPAPDANQ